MQPIGQPGSRLPRSRRVRPRAWLGTGGIAAIRRLPAGPALAGRSGCRTSAPAKLAASAGAAGRMLPALCWPRGLGHAARQVRLLLRPDPCNLSKQTCRHAASSRKADKRRLWLQPSFHAPCAAPPELARQASLDNSITRPRKPSARESGAPCAEAARGGTGSRDAMEGCPPRLRREKDRHWGESSKSSSGFAWEEAGV